VDGTRGSGRPVWGAVAEALTLIALPAVVVVSAHTDSLAAVALVLAGVNLFGLLAIAPALLGIKHRRKTSFPPSVQTAAVALAATGSTAAGSPLAKQGH
ncbi:MAG TPA: hypothetical protein VFH13_04360, partial [Gemmatimonadaceae bacterium]|nr:hypothetical protein [Gemmatimonadaceae bacterium]